MKAPESIAGAFKPFLCLTPIPFLARVFRRAGRHGALVGGRHSHQRLDEGVSRTREHRLPLWERDRGRADEAFAR
ncbi:hypothetical protein [Ktedonobacter racemifer]|uniref:hypothetical protein n=1 Tax=Ktedonobacter racemifer TaxID=363277 RepID=UPI0012FC4C12|nr:hypothetical protein [Ktedonobacter racemifer]